MDPFCNGLCHVTKNMYPSFIGYTRRYSLKPKRWTQTLTPSSPNRRPPHRSHIHKPLLQIHLCYNPYNTHINNIGHILKQWCTNCVSQPKHGLPEKIFLELCKNTMGMQLHAPNKKNAFKTCRMSRIYSLRIYRLPRNAAYFASSLGMSLYPECTVMQ